MWHEEVHFVYISLDFRGESLPSDLQELGPDEMPTMAASRSSFAEPDETGEIPYIAPTIDSLHGNSLLINSCNGFFTIYVQHTVAFYTKITKTRSQSRV